MTCAKMVPIARTCPACGASNRIYAITPEARPSWKINCSQCGNLLFGFRGPTPADATAPAEEPRRAAAPQQIATSPSGRRAVRAGAVAARRPRRMRITRPHGIAPNPGHALTGGVVALMLLATIFRSGEIGDATGKAITAAGGPAPAAGPVAARSMRAPIAPSFAFSAPLAGPPAIPGAAEDRADPDPRAGIAAVELAEAPDHGGGADPRAGMPAAAQALNLGSGAAVEAALDLTRSDRREMQRRLKLAEFDPELVDGIFGPATRAAIGAWQETAGLPATGYLDGAAMERLVAETEPAYRAWAAAERARAERSRLAALATPVPPRRPFEEDGCRRLASGEIAYGQNLRCDLHGLGDELRGLRDGVLTAFETAEPSHSQARPGTKRHDA